MTQLSEEAKKSVDDYSHNFTVQLSLFTFFLDNIHIFVHKAIDLLSEQKCVNLLFYAQSIKLLEQFSQKCLLSPHTECSVYYFPKVKGCCSETVHFWPHIGKAKMCLRGGNFFSIFKNLFALFVSLFIIFQVNCHLSYTFWLHQCKVKYVPFQSYNHLL